MGCVTKKAPMCESLDLYAPCFAVNGNDIKVLQSPIEFYTSLLNGIRTAKHRIVLSALYLGISQMEEQLVQSVTEALNQSEASKGSLEVDILFDCVRGSRGEKNSRTMLLPLVKQYGDPSSTTERKTKVKVSFYHTPSLRGAWKQLLPMRFNEVVGLSHLKVFIFDDTFIISGANLSADYFEKRQDRYMQFDNCKLLGNHFQSLIRSVSTFSFQLQSDGNLLLSDQCPQHPFDGNYNLFIDYARERLQGLTYPYDVEYQNIPTNLDQLGFFNHLLSSAFSFFRYFGLWRQSTLRDHVKIKDTATSTHQSQRAVLENCTTDDADTWVYPSIQMGIAGIRQDELITKLLFKGFSNDSNVCFTSGYFNITDENSNAILTSPANFEILTASPEANGFLGARGFAGNIPAVYIYFTKLFYDQVCKNGQNDKINIWEYMRPQWTYHAKGLWYYEKNKKLPSVTMIGSSNFGMRSVNRDLEAQVTVVTRNKNLMKQLHAEKCDLFKWSKPVTSETFSQSRYFVPRWVSVVSNLIKHYF